MREKKEKTILPPLYSSTVKAGFPNPVGDEIDKHLDLNEMIVKHPASTFYVRVSGNSMINAGILNGDLLVIDRSITAQNGDIILAILNGEFTVKRLLKTDIKISLIPENKDYKPIEIKETDDFEVWGVVIFSIHELKK